MGWASFARKKDETVAGLDFFLREGCHQGLMFTVLCDVFASGGKTARVVVQILLIVVFFSGVGGWGGVKTSMLTPS